MEEKCVSDCIPEAPPILGNSRDLLNYSVWLSLFLVRYETKRSGGGSPSPLLIMQHLEMMRESEDALPIDEKDSPPFCNGSISFPHFRLSP